MQNRRKFIEKVIQGSALLGATSLASPLLLSSCQTLDEALITDPPDLEDQVCIIGGGVTGLFCAYELKKRKIPFRLFEASRRLGGQILSSGSNEYGAHIFSAQSTVLLNLCKELGVSTLKIDNMNWTFKFGSQDFLNRLVEVVSGLVPERQIRLSHELIKLQNNNKLKLLTFANPQNDKVYKASKVLFAVPLVEWTKIDGLVDRLVESEQIQNLRVVQVQSTQTPVISAFKKNVTKVQIDDVFVEIKKNKSAIYFTLRTDLLKSSLPQEIENIEKWIQAKLFPDSRLKLATAENEFYDWTNHPTIHISSLKPGGVAKSITLKDRQMMVLNEALLPDDGLDRVESLLRQARSQIDRLI